MCAERAVGKSLPMAAPGREHCASPADRTAREREARPGREAREIRIEEGGHSASFVGRPLGKARRRPVLASVGSRQQRRLASAKGGGPVRASRSGSQPPLVSPVQPSRPRQASRPVRRPSRPSPKPSPRQNRQFSRPSRHQIRCPHIATQPARKPPIGSKWSTKNVAKPSRRRSGFVGVG